VGDIATVELYMVGSRDNPNKAMLQLPAEVAGSPPLVVATESPLQGEKYCKGCSTNHWRQSWSYLHHMQVGPVDHVDVSMLFVVVK